MKTQDFPRTPAGNIDWNAVEAERKKHDACQQTPCAACLARVEDAIKSPLFTHARARRFLHCYGDWQVLIYHRDTTSPTGVMLAAGGLDKWVAPLLAKHGKTSPLSPSEMLSGNTGNNFVQ